MAGERTCPVWVWLPGEIMPRLAGKFRHENARGEFIYDGAYLAAGYPPLAPDMATRAARCRIAEGAGIFPIFMDAGPDTWGLHLLERRLERQIDLFESLTLCPVDGVGNLALGELTEARLRILRVDEFLAVLDEISARGKVVTDVQEQVLDAVENGTSLGGTKPKLTLERGGIQYLAKFPVKGDDPWLPHVESAMLKLARRCGIDACEGEVWRLPDNRNTALLIRRFDRVPLAGSQGRLGFVSAHSVLRLDKQPLNVTQADASLLGFANLGFSTDSLRKSYVALADAMARWCGGSGYHREARRELWRRITFNAMIRNTDDHARNHGLLCEDMAARRWRLAPAYDLVAPPIAREKPSLALAYLYVPPSARQQARLVWAATKPDLIRAAVLHYGFQAPEAQEAFEAIEATVQAGWRELLAGEGVPEDVVDRYARTFAPLSQIG
jgi:serine/threonine-protein kinase HipA